MIKEELDVLFLFETRINVNAKEVHEGFTFIFSSAVLDTTRDNAEQIRKNERNKKKNDPSRLNGFQLYHLDAEKLGSAVIYNEQVKKSVVDCLQHNERNITLTLKTNIGNINLSGTHAPHAEATEKEKDEYYNDLDHYHTLYGKGPNIHIIGGISTLDY